MIIWRPYRRQDKAALERRHHAQCSRSGVDFAFPDLDDPRYLVTEVAEYNGRIVGAVTAHATIEVMFVGADPLVARAAVRARRRFIQRLQQAGADEAHAFVPNRLLTKMRPLMRLLGFAQSNQDYTVFYQSL